VVVVVELELQPARNKMGTKHTPNSSPTINRRWRERLPPSPTPSSASPDTGNQAA